MSRRGWGEKAGASLWDQVGRHRWNRMMGLGIV